MVKALAGAGARLVAIDIAEQFETPGAALAIGGVDTADLQAAERAVETIRTTLGAMHGLVNIAGGFHWETVLEGSLESWDMMYRTNLRTTIAMSKAAAPVLEWRRHRECRRCRRRQGRARHGELRRLESRGRQTDRSDG